MKILVLTDKMELGGAETHIYTLIYELFTRGESVTLICAGGAYADDLARCGIKCKFAPFDKRTPMSIRESIHMLEKEINEYDIVHTHTRFTSFIAKTARRDKKTPPIVTTAHLNFPTFPFGSFAFWGEGTLAVSYDIEDYLKKSCNVKNKNIFITKNSIDTSLFKVSNQRNKIIVHTSRIDTGRAITAFMLVEISENLVKEYPDFKILIIGDGNKYQKLKNLAMDVNRKIGFPVVILTGARSDLYEIIRHGVIFVGASRSALEGMASGLPTIICGDDGYGGITTENNFDLLAKTNFCARGCEKPNKERLLSDIKYLIKNPGISLHLGNYLRKRIEEDYHPSSMANDALKCYKSVLRKPRIILVGFFGYNNLGDEETLNSAIKVLNEVGVKDISILSAKDSYRNNSAIKVYNRMNLSKIAEGINASDIVILCGGNLLQNETSTRSLLYYAKIISFAKNRKRSVYMLSSGFGEIKNKFADKLLQKSIKSCDFCGCRTSYDLDIAKKYCLNSTLMPDLCFLLPQHQNPCQKDSFAWIVTRNTVISISEIKRIAQSRGLSPIAIMLYKNEDKELITTLKNNDIKYFTAHNFYKFSSIIKKCAFAICERLHGAIFSLLCHTPVYITVENCKNRALLEEITQRCTNQYIIFPYKIQDIINKKEIGAQDSDFKYVIQSMKNDIYTALENLF